MFGNRVHDDVRGKLAEGFQGLTDEVAGGGHHVICVGGLTTFQLHDGIKNFVALPEVIRVLHMGVWRLTKDLEDATVAVMITGVGGGRVSGVVGRLLVVGVAIESGSGTVGWTAVLGMGVLAADSGKSGSRLIRGCANGRGEWVRGLCVVVICGLNLVVVVCGDVDCGSGLCGITSGCGGNR